MNRNDRRLALGALAAAAALAGGAAAAPPTLADLVADADLVVRGTVVDVRYRVSRPCDDEGAGLPHSFVTYRLDDVILGDASPGDEIVLRFVGGLDHASMEMVLPTNAPRIDLGDDDLLMIAGNGERQVPLAGGLRGRLRVIGERLYTEGGREVSLDGAGRLRAGRRFGFDAVRTYSIEGRAFEMQLGPDTLDAALANGESRAMLADAFRDLAAAFAGPGKRRRAFASADPDLPFDGPDLRAVAAPAVPAALAPAAPAPADDGEVESLDDGPNPVKRAERRARG